jgi:DtxR family Mn-dependent transcriptional regulator
MIDDLSPTMRDYLAEVYRLSDHSHSDYVTTSALADMLDVTAPAVNRMITRLREQGLLDHEPYQGIRLTEAGRRAALKALRRHRIAEAFLVSVMGFGWHEVHDEARRISTALSDTLAERMAHMAGGPAYCPHGEPIPTADGTVEHIDDRAIAETPAESGPQVVTRVLTREPDRLEYLAALGLTPGRQLEVLHIAPFHGPIQLRLGDEYRIIGHNLAEQIRVRPAG